MANGIKLFHKNLSPQLIFPFEVDCFSYEIDVSDVAYKFYISYILYILCKRFGGDFGGGLGGMGNMT